ncbi:MAG: mechanosensitive ion channel [Gammaproteobacteria bacterium]|nr:mechanosensitive ion channel [Gammaproteobacteria bacterium]
MNEEIQKLTDGTSGIAGMAIDLAMIHGPALVLAVLTLGIGLWVINRVVALLHRTMEARSVEPTLARFLRSLVSVGLKVLLFVSVLGMIGIETTSFIAVLGGAALAIGLALQGSLSNFAGGVLILLFRPFRVGQVIETQGSLGTVDEIGILHTVLKTFDNRTIIIPNGDLANDRIVNLSLEATRRAEWTFGVSYDDDIRRVRETLGEVLATEERILAEPEPTIVLSAFADSSVNFMVRAWVPAAELWPVIWDVNEKVKLAFDEQGITIPFPQRDLHMKSGSASG